VSQRVPNVLIGWQCSHFHPSATAPDGYENFSDGRSYELVLLVPADWRDQPVYQEHFRKAKAKADAHAVAHGCSPKFFEDKWEYEANKSRQPSASVGEYRAWIIP
jgi:hypothetical protein